VAVPRPVLLAILGLALCVTALVAVRGMGTGEEDAVAPAPIPTAPVDKTPAQPGARGRARTRPHVQESAVPATPADKADKGSAADKPARKLSKSEVAKLKADAQIVAVARSLGQNDVVVLFFSRPGAADDTGAEQAVNTLDGTKGLQIYKPNFEDLDDYRPILAGVGVAQVPAIVIVKPGRKAQLVEGFVDQKSLRQQVEDSLR